MRERKGDIDCLLCRRHRIQGKFYRGESRMLSRVIFIVVHTVLRCVDALQQTGIGLALVRVVVAVHRDIFGVLRALAVAVTGKTGA